MRLLAGSGVLADAILIPTRPMIPPINTICMFSPAYKMVNHVNTSFKYAHHIGLCYQRVASEGNVATTNFANLIILHLSIYVNPHT